MCSSDLKPMTNADFAVDLPARTAPGEYHLNFEVTLAADTPWAKAGHEIYQTQFALETIPAPRPPARSGKIDLAFDNATGLLTRCERDGIAYLTGGATEALWRPYAGMDSHPVWGPWAELWQPRPRQFKQITTAGERTIVTTDTGEIVYSVREGRLCIEAEVRVTNSPRVGIGLVVAPGFEKLEWFGRGPEIGRAHV